MKSEIDAAKNRNDWENVMSLRTRTTKKDASELLWKIANTSPGIIASILEKNFGMKKDEATSTAFLIHKNLYSFNYRIKEIMS